MFRGLYEISLDTKGRLSVPVKVRGVIEDECDGQVVMTVDIKKHLTIYGLEEWEKVSVQLQKLSSFEPRQRMIKDLYLGHAMDVELDSTGRWLIPPPLRKFAGLEKKVILNGSGSKLMLWDQVAFEANRDAGMKMLMAEGFDFGETLEAMAI